MTIALLYLFSLIVIVLPLFAVLSRGLENE